jgi:ribosomal protein S18 acetylase RimI-like enzyme
MDLRFQNISTADAYAISELEMMLFPDNCMNEYTLDREIQAGTGFVIYDGQKLIGYMLVRCDPEDEVLDLLRLGIHTDYQRRGLGKRLLNELDQKDLKDFMLTVKKSNIVALRLYSSRGFQIVGELESSWIMRRTTL